MKYPPFVCYSTIEEYKEHFRIKYCQMPIITFDNFKVRFRRNQFDHCFYESTNRNRIKDCFSKERAKRIDWIEAALHDPHADLYKGWDRDRRRYNSSRRVAIVMDYYVVVIQVIRNENANFVTAYVADSTTTIDRIRNGPRWQ